MRWAMGLLALACAALLGAPFAAAEGPTRDEYRAAAEPICKANIDANHRILAGARKRVSRGKLKPAGRQFIHAAATFGRTIRELARVPRPPAYRARLARWLRILRKIQADLRKAGVALKHGDKFRARLNLVFAEQSGNSANNVGEPFKFNYCRMTRSRFT